MSRVQVVLKPRKAQPFFGRHPWVLDSAVSHLIGEPTDGGEADLLSEGGQWIARGIYNSRSRIRMRLYSWSPEAELNDVWSQRLESAVRLRATCGYDDPQGAARLVFSEADGLSGLVVDRFGEYLVVQPTSLAFAERLPWLLDRLEEIIKPRGIYVRTEEGTARREGLELQGAVVRGEIPGEGVTISEHGISYRVSLTAGQKTGFYLDQRENRAAAARFMRGRSVLDMCCYSGGFSLCAAKLGGAKQVLGIDSSRPALESATANALSNGLENVSFEHGECFETLERFASEGRIFEAVILDPPKFVRGKGGVEEALRAYHRINQLAVKILAPEGILVSCSCSGSVTREDFQEMLFGVALKAKRDIRILEQRGASHDHPTSVLCPETSYLKCFLCRVS